MARGTTWFKAKRAKLAPQLVEVAREAEAKDLYHVIHHDTLTKAELRTLAAQASEGVVVRRCKAGEYTPSEGKQRRRLWGAENHKAQRRYGAHSDVRARPKHSAAYYASA